MAERSDMGAAAIEEDGQTIWVPVESLRGADSPRLAGENIDHVLVLNETEATFPPILVHRATMRVIDGMHRLRAARLRGDDRIEVRFFDGNEEDAFVHAVAANIAHGLPLSLPDRTAAAARIVSSHTHWSDRRIAEITGLAATTVGSIRRRSNDVFTQSNIRVGRDMRARPVNNSSGRALAGELMTQSPDLPLRQVAKAAGISVSTAHDVRKRIRQGQHPVPPRQRNGSDAESATAKTSAPEVTNGARRLQTADVGPILRRLRADPSLRFSDSGRELLRWLVLHTSDVHQWERLIGSIPVYSRPSVVELARGISEAWHEFADRLDELGETES
jgi:ParB-like nuclease family protein